MEQVQNHADDLSLHLPNAGEHIRVDGIRDGELAKGLGLKLEQLVLAVVHGPRDIAILPTGVIHIGEVLQLGTDSVRGQTVLGQHEMAGHVGLDELIRHFGKRLADLFLDLSANARGAQEVTVCDAANIMVEFEDGAEDATALELPKCFSSPAEDEVDEDDIAQAEGRGSHWSATIVRDSIGNYGTHRSRFSMSADSDTLGFLFLTDSKLPLKLTGILELPGIATDVGGLE